MGDLAESLDTGARSALDIALTGEFDAEGNPVTVSSLGSQLQATLSRIIALHWDTGGTKNHLDAVVANVASRIKSQPLVNVKPDSPRPVAARAIHNASLMAQHNQEPTTVAYQEIISKNLVSLEGESLEHK